VNKHFIGDGDIVYQQSCKLGCEVIVSKRIGSPYPSGRSKQWVKVKNPAAPAVRRELPRRSGVKCRLRISNSAGMSPSFQGKGNSSGPLVN